MTIDVLIFASIMSPALWLWTIRLLRKWPKIYTFVFANILLLVIYEYLIFYIDGIRPDDRSGYAAMYCAMVFLIIHSLIAFAFSLLYSHKFLNDANG